MFCYFIKCSISRFLPDFLLPSTACLLLLPLVIRKYSSPSDSGCTKHLTLALSLAMLFFEPDLFLHSSYSGETFHQHLVVVLFAHLFLDVQNRLLLLHHCRRNLLLQHLNILRILALSSRPRLVCLLLLACYLRMSIPSAITARLHRVSLHLALTCTMTCLLALVTDYVLKICFWLALPNN